MNQYDYIIAGAGAAGLSLLMHMIHSGKFADKKILLADKHPKTENDRTWCFWQNDQGLFENIVYKRWNHLQFYGIKSFHASNDINPYQYKLIRGIDFYNFCFDTISGQSNIEVIYGAVENCVSNTDETYIVLSGEKYFAKFIFNSILFHKPELSAGEIFLLQHFKGWMIETENPVFNVNQATLMDFRVTQGYGTAFVYLMPFSASSALIEFTVFSSSVLTDEAYDRELTTYCEQRLGLTKDLFHIHSTETGRIPMTNHLFKSRSGNIINIGTAGGQTKPSTGYTFNFIQKNCKEIIQNLVTSGDPGQHNGSAKFRFYDSVLLQVLQNGSPSGAEVFTTLFSKNQMKDIFEFLDNETTLAEDLSIIRHLPFGTFTKAALNNLSLLNIPKKKKSSKLLSTEDFSSKN